MKNKINVWKIRPCGEQGWMYIRTNEELIVTLNDMCYGGDEIVEVCTEKMTEAKFKKLPEHEGW